MTPAEIEHICPQSEVFHQTLWIASWAPETKGPAIVHDEYNGGDYRDEEYPINFCPYCGINLRAP